MMNTVNNPVTRMKLLTRENLAALPALGSQEEKGLDAIAQVKFFDPCGSWTWYMSEYDPATHEGFGLVDGAEEELGYFNLDELAGVKGRLGIGIERDRGWTPRPLRECYRNKNLG